MAIYHLSAKLISRKAGRSATGAAAYRAGERIVDERTGMIHDYTRKGGVEHVQIVTPAGIEPPTRADLWNAVEAKNKRADAQVAREFEVALPAEISSHGRRQLALAFARHIADTYGVAADVAIHAPGRDGDRRNHHAHILTTTNTLNPDGSLGNKARVLDAVAHDRSKGDRGGPNEIEKLRETWAELVNRALQREGVDARIDHRGLDAQRAAAIERGDGRQARQLERVPTVHLGPNVARMERRGIRTERGGQGREVAARNAQIIDLAEARKRIEAELNALEAASKPPPGRERHGPAVQSARFRVLDKKLSDTGRTSQNPPLASNQTTQPGMPMKSAQGHAERNPLGSGWEIQKRASERPVAAVRPWSAAAVAADLRQIDPNAPIEQQARALETLVNRMADARRAVFDWAVGKASEREDRRRKAARRLWEAKPQPPGGLLARFKQRDYETALVQWQADMERARRLQEQAEKTRSRISYANLYVDGRELARKEIAHTAPELTGRIEAHRQAERQKAQERMKNERQARQKGRTGPRPRR